MDMITIDEALRVNATTSTEGDLELDVLVEIYRETGNLFPTREDIDRYWKERLE